MGLNCVSRKTPTQDAVVLFVHSKNPGPLDYVRDDRLRLRSTLFFGVRCRVSSRRSSELGLGKQVSATAFPVSETSYKTRNLMEW